MQTRASYSALQIALHWVIAILIVANYIVSDGMGRSLHQSLKGEAITSSAPKFHVYVGIAILVLAVIRLIVRLTQGAPEVPHADTLIGKIGTWTHWLLYALMILVPVFGMMAWFGGIGSMGDVHVVAMNVLMILALLHVAAALYHQFVLKDGLIMRMLRPN